MNQTDEKPLSIIGAADVILAQQTARKMARGLAFDERASEEIAIAASELASNLVRHAAGGTLTFTSMHAAERVGLKMEATDHGPSIPDVEQAIMDGYSTAGGLGRGLGAVHRLMDQMDIASAPGQGTRVTCCRWLRAKSEPAVRQLLDFGAATRAYRLGPENGDAFVLKRWGRGALAGVIDGLGHGALAQQAALAARQYIENHCDQPLASIFRGTGRACRSTRGVVMALAQFDLEAERFSFGSVGNIEARLFGGPADLNLIVRRGIIGGNAPEPRITEHPWSASCILVLHSDGLKARWAWSDFPNLSIEPATLISQRLLRALDRGEDDATVVVVKGVAP